MTERTFALCSTALLVAVGCSSVTIPEPLGENDPQACKRLEGAWINDRDEVLEAHVSKTGQLFVGGLEWDESKNQFRAETLNVRATKAGQLQLLHANGDPKSSDKRFVFGRYEINDDKTVRIYPPIVSVFEDAVNFGKLKGTVRKKRYETEVRLDDPADVVLKFIMKAGTDGCFEKEPSLTFKLLSRGD